MPGQISSTNKEVFVSEVPLSRVVAWLARANEALKRQSKMPVSTFPPMKLQWSKAMTTHRGLPSAAASGYGRCGNSTWVNGRPRKCPRRSSSCYKSVFSASANVMGWSNWRLPDDKLPRYGAGSLFGMAVQVTLKRGVHDTTPQVESFDGEDDEYWFETLGTTKVLKVGRASDGTTKTYAEGQWLTVDGKERLPGFA